MLFEGCFIIVLCFIRVLNSNCSTLGATRGVLGFTSNETLVFPILSLTISLFLVAMRLSVLCATKLLVTDYDGSCEAGVLGCEGSWGAGRLSLSPFFLNQCINMSMICLSGYSFLRMDSLGFRSVTWSSLGFTTSGVTSELDLPICLGSGNTTAHYTYYISFCNALNSSSLSRFMYF